MHSLTYIVNAVMIFFLDSIENVVENNCENNPAVVAWFAKASVFHSVNFTFESQRTVDRIPLEAWCLIWSLLPQTCVISIGNSSTQSGLMTQI